MSDQNKTPVDCVGIVCFRDNDVLLIQRGKPPRIGEWSIPGGRIESAESELDAAIRELEEETSILAKIVSKVEIVNASFEGITYRLHDYAAIWESGEPQAGDDAMNAEFMPLEKALALNMWSETKRIILKSHKILTEKGHFK